ncbi:MAG: T9SS type A sorting domain-containing protein [Crocinitomicaceae bacterium]
MVFQSKPIRLNSILLMLFFPLMGSAQYTHPFTFDDTYHEDFVFRDTISNSNCIWRIGTPQKTVFTSSKSSPNSIITDTLNPYPINDTSSFIIKHKAENGFLSNVLVRLGVSYFVNSDSLNDFGKIEFSPDNGNSWVLISDDTLNLISGGTWPNYIFGNFNLTGNSNGWESVLINLSNYPYSSISTGDTVQYRFTFISDSNFDNLDGLMFDDIIALDDAVPWGIDELSSSTINAYPNPFTTIINLKSKYHINARLNIFSITGKLVYNTELKNEVQVKINTVDFKSGIYFYEVINENGLSKERGKMIKN